MLIPKLDFQLKRIFNCHVNSCINHNLLFARPALPLLRLECSDLSFTSFPGFWLYLGSDLFLDVSREAELEVLWGYLATVRALPFEVHTGSGATLAKNVFAG